MEETLPGMSFPCQVDIKVFMKASKGNSDQVRGLILELLDAGQLRFIKGKTSRNGTYQSLSCCVHVDSREEIDAVFERLTSHPDILMVI